MKTLAKVVFAAFVAIGIGALVGSHVTVKVKPPTTIPAVTVASVQPMPAAQTNGLRFDGLHVNPEVQ